MLARASSSPLRQREMEAAGPLEADVDAGLLLQLGGEAAPRHSDERIVQPA